MTTRERAIAALVWEISNSDIIHGQYKPERLAQLAYDTLAPIIEADYATAIAERDATIAEYAAATTTATAAINKMIGREQA